jgi:hypothetical protein
MSAPPRPADPKVGTERSERPQARPGAEPSGGRLAPRRPVQPATREIGGPQGPEPTRYGDWEKGGRCSDF